MKKEWREWPDPCDECGGTLEIYTLHKNYGCCRDGDKVRCIGCGAKGKMVEPNFDDIEIEWLEED